MEFRFSLHGAVMQVELPADSALEGLRARLPGEVVEADGETADVVYRVGADLGAFRDGISLGRAATMDGALDALVSDLHFQVACHARTALFVHAGVVALQGKAIVFPGRTYAGKSTMVAALVRAGATYFSDEYAVLDTEGRVSPYLKPISLRDAQGVGRPYSVASLGGRSGSVPVPVGLIVATTYRAGAVWAPQEISPATALLAMVENTVRALEVPELMMRSLAAVARCATAVAGERGETDAVVGYLLEKFGMQ